MIARPPGVHLGNWREAPANRWAFHHVRELIPTERVRACCPPATAGLAVERRAVSTLPGGGDLAAFLERSQTTALVALRAGKVLVEWYADEDCAGEPHIVFSVSKSLTGLLAGAAADRGLLDPAAPVSHYLPEVAVTAYADCTVRHLLDMTVSVVFDESYLTRDGQYGRYRAATGWNPPLPGATSETLHGFLLTLPRAPGEHGHAFRYVSPNADLLGWVIERAAGQRLAHLLSEWLWQPLRAETDAYVTVDAEGAARTAGGFCATARDLARVGEMMLGQGKLHGMRVLSAEWVRECTATGDAGAWQRGEFAALLPHGRYRNQWYQTGAPGSAYFALGIHGQWLYVDPPSETVIVKFAAQAAPLDDDLDLANLAVFASLCET